MVKSGTTVLDSPQRRYSTCTNEISVSDVNSAKKFSRDYLYVFKNALPKICC